jgi:thioredoxin-related protein
MKIITMLTVVALVAIGALSFFDSSGSATETENKNASLQWRSFDEGVTLTKQENKKLLIDVYTDWCGWCKKMDKEVYGNEAVKNILGKKFVVVKLNAESNKTLTFNGNTMSEMAFAQGAGVTGYPTTIFIDSDTKPITLLPGYVESKEFFKILTYIGDNHYKTTKYEDFLLKSGIPN